MKPAPFKYLDVSSDDELAAALFEHGDDATLLAGGQSLVPMMNFRVVTPTILIDLNRLDALGRAEFDAGTLRIGALTRHAAIEDSADIADRCPLLVQAVKHVAHRAVRTRGTTGGSLALAYPGAEIPLALMTLDAAVTLASRQGQRKVAINDFIVGALDTALSPQEYIRSIEITLPPQDCAVSFVETTRRHGDFAIGAAAVVARRDGAGRVTYIRAGVSGGTGAPIRLTAIEQAVAGGDEIGDACRAAINGVEVFGDHHYPEDYRRDVLAAVLQHALNTALGKPGVRHAR
jgi:carbon-monoxide dehydrogenase medium subunit/6-hydroxypseudooxynicotine dehydrogenase subunit alpha